MKLSNEPFKKMKKLLSLFILFSLTLTSAFADNASDARKVLDKTASMVVKKGGAVASFSISGGKIGKQSGTISIKGNKFCASTGAATIWYNGKTQWTYVKANDEVNVSSPKASQQQVMNPYYFLNIYKKGYTLSVNTQGKNKVVHMVAQGKKSIQEAYITVTPDGTPTQIRMKQQGGWITILISKFQQKSLSDSSFTFNSKDYPHAEIIDLR